jgi:acetyl-CoA C-acetyltransferase
MRSSRYRSKTHKGLSSFVEDEHKNPDTNVEKLTRGKPLFRKDDTIAGGNAPGLNRAGAAMIVAGRGWAEKRSVEPPACPASYGIGASIPEYSWVWGRSPPSVRHLNAPIRQLQTSIV